MVRSSSSNYNHSQQALGRCSRARQSQVKKIGSNSVPVLKIDGLTHDVPSPIKSARLFISRKPPELQHLPTEIIERIAWLSLNPGVTSTSQVLSSKLPSRELFKIDILMLAFCGWKDVDKKPESIPWTTKAAFNDLIVLSDEEKDDLQCRCLESDWCNLDLLKKAALRLAQTWLNHHWGIDITVAKNRLAYNRVSTSKTQLFKYKAVRFRSPECRNHFLSVVNFSKMQICCGFTCNGDNCALQDQNMNFATRHIPARLLSAPFSQDKLEFLIFLRCCRGSTTEDTPNCTLTEVNNAIFEAIELGNNTMLPVLMEMRESLTVSPGPFEFLCHSEIQTQTRDMLLAATCQKKYEGLTILLKCLLDRSFDSTEMLERVLWYAERDWLAGHQGAVDFRRFYYGYGQQLLGRLNRPARMNLRYQYSVDHNISGEQIMGPMKSLI